MKNYFIALLLCCAVFNAVAQDKNATVTAKLYEPNWAKLLAKLDTLQIKSGVLYDKVTPFSNLVAFNDEKNNVSTHEHFVQAMSELYRASNKKLFRSVSDLKELSNSVPENTVAVGIINTSFQLLNIDEITPDNGGLIMRDSLYLPLNDKPSFLERKAVVASPLKEWVNGEDIVFKFSNELIFNNATAKIKAMEIDFENKETPIILIENGVLVSNEIKVRYAESGMKTLKFTIVFNDESKTITYGRMYVNVINDHSTSDVSPCDEFLRDKGTWSSNLPFQGYTESMPINGKIEYTIFYHTSNGNALKMLAKPIIVVDGFDPKDKRKVTDCDCANDTTPGPFNCRLLNSELKFNNGLSPMFTLVYNPKNHESIVDSFYYPDGTGAIDPITGLPKTINLMDRLRSEGYDVIIINNPSYVSPQGIAIDGGADYIERNAYNLVSFIKGYVKNPLRNTNVDEPLVFIGPSMGGQITRYALAYMEKKFAETGDLNWKHNARLWVSVDSPHLGSNIPVGAQANLWFFGYRLDNVEVKDKFDNELNSVAGKQLIISSFKNALDTGGSTTIPGYSPFGPSYFYANQTGNGGHLNSSPFFNQYYDNLNANGFAGSNGFPVSVPGQFRKIAMVNGSLNGTKIGQENQTFLDMRVYIDMSFLWFNWRVTLARITDKFAPATGQSGVVFKGDGQNFSIGFNHWYFNHSWYTLIENNNDIRGSLDVVPGGKYKTAKLLKEGVEKGASDGGFRSEVRQPYLESNSFIPSFSSLAHLQPNQDWSNPLNNNLKCPSNNLTPFDSYYGAADNSGHTEFTKESADWLMKELAGASQAPWFPLESGLLNGPDILCDVPNTNYFFSDSCKLPSAVIYTDQTGAMVNGWSVSSNLHIESSTGSSINVTGLQSGIGTITATFQNGETITKSITIYHVPTLPTPSGSLYVDAVDCYNDGPLTINFDSDVPFGGIITLNPSTLPHPLRSQTKNITVKYTNPCTGAFTTSVITFYYQAPDCSTAKMNTNNSFFTIFPNPTSDVVNVMLADENKLPVNTSTIAAELFDMMEQSKGSVSVLNNTASINVAALPKGIYVLKIYIDGKVEYHQVAVQ